LLDAHCDIADQLLIFHSRGGTIGTPNARNTQYSDGLRVLMERIPASTLSLSRVSVDSSAVQALSIDERTVLSNSETDQPAADLFELISNRMKAVGRKPDAKGPGNATKRLRFDFSGEATQASIIDAVGVEFVNRDLRSADRLPADQLNLVSSDHIVGAVETLVGGAEAPDYGPSTDYDVVMDDGTTLAPKTVFGLAASEALGFVVLPRHFTGGVGTPCFNAIEAAGYKIIRKDASENAPARIEVSSSDEDRVTAGPQYPFTSYSWVIYSPKVAVKQMDKSAFLHGGTGVPRNVSFFFNFDPADERKSVSLVHAGKQYEGHLSPDVENQRVRLFWQATFSKLIEELMPGRHSQFINDDDQTVAPAEMRFVKEADDVFMVEFLEPETIIADAENLDEEPSGSTARKEGTAKTVTSTHYERDPQNRLDAIRIHGHRCVACGFDFGQVYGEWGEGYIEVHHLIPLAEADEDHEVNPATDLAPVCANCHRMIHRRRKETLSVERLRELIQGIS
jgi:hypothetical protein